VILYIFFSPYTSIFTGLLASLPPLPATFQFPVLKCTVCTDASSVYIARTFLKTTTRPRRR